MSDDRNWEADFADVVACANPCGFCDHQPMNADLQFQFELTCEQAQRFCLAYQAISGTHIQVAESLLPDFETVFSVLAALYVLSNGLVTACARTSGLGEGESVVVDGIEYAVGEEDTWDEENP